jgi:hypothetical protein
MESSDIFFTSAHLVLMLNLQQNQTQPLDLKCDFNLHNLPVGFASHLSRQQDGTIDRTPVNNAINKLAEIVWKQGGFGFWHRKTKWDKLWFLYLCSQDADRARPSITKGQRDTPRMERYSCQSRLTFSPSFQERVLTVTLRHTYHTSYVDRQLSPAVLEFIQARNAISTPAEIFRDMQAAQPLGWELATSQQVYYQWQQLNSNVWRRDPDPVISAQTLLSEHSEYTSSTYFVLRACLPPTLSDALWYRNHTSRKPMGNVGIILRGNTSCCDSTRNARCADPFFLSSS